jgi:hypothetical protein
MDVVYRNAFPGSERIHVEITPADLPGLIGDLACSESAAGRWLLRQLMAELAGRKAAPSPTITAHAYVGPGPCGVLRFGTQCGGGQDEHGADEDDR